MSDDEYDSNMCPLCVEEMDLSDKNFLPCPCGYRVCMWCWHHIRENLNGLCPACRTPYNADPHLFSAVDRQEVVKKNRERKQKEKQEKKVDGTKVAKVVDRKHLHNFRVVQRNLVYVLGLPSTASNSEVLRKPEYFGQYGKMTKIVVHTNPNLSHNTVSAYATFAYKEDALAAIQALDGFWIDGHPLRASFGTTKYCNNFIRHVPCQNPDCVYLHELGDEDDRFTKEEIQSGHSKASLVPGKDQQLVTGQGGPSGTGKKPNGDTVLPPPVFIQDTNPPPLPKPGNISRSQSSAPLEDKDIVIKGNSNPQEQEDFDTVTPSSKAIISSGPPSILSKKETSETSTLDAFRSEESKVSISVDNATVPAEVSDALIRTDISTNPKAFNGVTWNAVFPVPSSSLSFTIWAGVIGRVADDSLVINPFSKSALSFSELLDLTLPPIDANFSNRGNPPVTRVSPSPMGTGNQQQNTPINGTGFNMLRQILPSANLYGSNGRPINE